MQLNDLTKDIQRVLLAHWTVEEINDRLGNPEYFFEHVVNPRLKYLREQGQETPSLRLGRTPEGELLVLLRS